MFPHTSHVTLYRDAWLSHAGGQSSFQYITCYSLSFTEDDLFCVVIKFQYITCYSLSQCLQDTLVLNVVSIHHMLLFIYSPFRRTVLYRKFQYITCYSLSYRIHPYLRHLHVSIHHMLLFIARHPQYAVVILRFNTSHVTLYPQVLMMILH